MRIDPKIIELTADVFFFFFFLQLQLLLGEGSSAFLERIFELLPY